MPPHPVDLLPSSFTPTIYLSFVGYYTRGYVPGSKGAPSFASLSCHNRMRPHLDMIRRDISRNSNHNYCSSWGCPEASSRIQGEDHPKITPETTLCHLGDQEWIKATTCSFFPYEGSTSIYLPSYLSVLLSPSAPSPFYLSRFPCVLMPYGLFS